MQKNTLSLRKFLCFTQLDEKTASYTTNSMYRNIFKICYKYLVLIFILFTVSGVSHATTSHLMPLLNYKHLSTDDGLPCNEVQDIFQDKEGFIWIATRYGLCRYDGYQFKTFRAALNTPGLLTNNNVFTLADDHNGTLWIGTQEGLNAFDKRTGRIRQFTYPSLPHNVISCLLVDKEHNVWIGTDTGLAQYIPERDTIVIHRGQEAGNLPNCAIKSLIQDADGDLWIGTWSNGLYRKPIERKTFISYPPLNDRNSANTVFQDSQGRIWVSGWDCGLYLLNNHKNVKEVTYRHFAHRNGDDNSLLDNIIYSIEEDPKTHSLWIGTRSGISIMQYTTDGERFVNYSSADEQHYLPGDEITSLLRDDAGHLWIGSIGGGVLMAETNKTNFRSYMSPMLDGTLPVNSIQALCMDRDNNLWIGIGGYGIARKDADTGQTIPHSKLPEFAGFGNTRINDILQRSNGELWFAAYDGGILIYKRKGEKVQRVNPGNASFIASYCPTSLYEDRHGNMWVGCHEGLGVKLTNGSEHRFNTIRLTDGRELPGWALHVKDIKEDADGSYWIATANVGLFHITGNIANPQSLCFTQYAFSNQKLSVNSTLCLHTDLWNRLWVGTAGGGLYQYDRERDSFVSKNQEFNIPSDMIASIEQDEKGNLWMGTNKGLVCISLTSTISMRLYTASDGLLGNFFQHNSSCHKDGILFFGGNNGYNSFCPAEMMEDTTSTTCCITDIRIFNKSVSVLDSILRKKICPTLPPYVKHITIPYDQNNFNIEFALLTYKNPLQNRYAYQLEGFDNNWKYTDATQRTAYYNNLKSGNYTFKVKATNENGVWSRQECILKIEVLPPFWATWWAYLIYIIVVIATVWQIFCMTKRRMLLKNELHLRQMEKDKIEELSHAKLQFFTNITHELLTPLTIISASVDELKLQAPSYTGIYQVMTNNVNRLMRLLQQILEFRKAETGNLKLRVAHANLADFIRKEAEGFRPLISKRKISFNVTCTPDDIMGYFDTDKLDKILYNLLSNAAKYNEEGGEINVILTYDSNPDFVLLRVKDNGEGISKEKQATLFQRFYEGDYRKFKTIGTGIGLSLTKDLTLLHQGTITVESEPGRGTEFTVRIPIEQSYYRDDQVEKVIEQPAMQFMENDADEQRDNPQTDLTTEFNDTNDCHSPSEHAVLVIEDNLDLLQLMTRLLKHEYRVFTAENGREGIAVLKQEDISLVVSDVMMPVMDGIDFCKYVKGHIELSHIPVILLTAKNKEEDRAEAYEVGADAFIAKPFNLTVLYARIRNLLKYRERVAYDFKNQLVFEAKDLDYTTIDEDFVERAVACVNHHLDDPDYDQTLFADEMNTSKSTLYKKLKSLTGLNTSGFICNVRLKAACRLMEEKQGALRISELAYTVGFNSPKYFTTCFKKEFGMLPTEYMERFMPGDKA